MLSSTLLLLAAGGSVVGFLLAVLGAGGAILLLPLLVGVADLPTDPAITLSLLIVMVLALANAMPYVQRRQIAVRAGLVLGLPAMLGSLIGASLARHGLVSDTAQLVIFVVAALIAAVLMVRPAAAAAPQELPLTRALQAPRSPLPLAGQGLLVGLLTGIAGVGGGFAVIPALVLLAGLPMQRATGTSLVLIVVNSLVALLALGQWPTSHLPLALPILAGGAAGAVIGQRLAPHLQDAHLRRGFAALLIGSALLTGAKTWQRHQPAERSSHSQRSLCAINHDPSSPGRSVCDHDHSPRV